MNPNQPTDPRVAALLHTLRLRPTDADCDRCQTQLYDYVETQLAEQDVRQQFSWTAVHLDSCVECAAAYATLFELLYAEQQQQLATPATLPKLDLSFLNLQPTLADSLKTAVRQIGQQLILQLSAPLLAQLQPTLQTTRSAGDGRYGEKLLELTSDQLPADTLPFTLLAFADRDQPDRCLVEITVEPPHLSWPDLADQIVTLTTPSQTVQATTDEWGTAVFPAIPRPALPNLTITITLPS